MTARRVRFYPDQQSAPDPANAEHDNASRWTEPSGEETARDSERAPDLQLDPLLQDLGREACGLFPRLLDNDLVGVCVILDGRLRYVNPRLAKLFGYTREELCAGMGLYDLTAPEYRSLASQEIERCVQHDTGNCRYSFEGLRKDGGRVFVELFCTSTRLEGRVSLIGLMIDNTDRHRAELEVQEQLYFTTQLVDAIPNPVFYKDEHGRYLGCNRAFEQYLGSPRHDIIGMSVFDLSPSELAERYAAADKLLFDNPGVQTYEALVKTADGSRRDVVFYKATFDKSDGSLGGLVGVILDITERKRSEQAIWREANHDQLTQLPNRRLFLDRLQQKMEEANRSGESIALLLIDLDSFKAVNDTFGHRSGDELLVTVASRITACLGESDVVARTGGDEFAVILPDTTKAAHVGQVARSIIHALEQPFHLGVEVAYVSASVGIAFYPTDARDLDTLLTSADQAMYHAKLNGKNRLSYFMPALQAAAMDRLQIGHDLRQAVALHQLEVYYQPILDLTSGRIVKAEALLRWHHPRRGMVSPAQFIPVAEDLGLINEIGDWVFAQAVGAAKRFAALTRDSSDGHPGPMLQISINKSPRQFLTGSTHEAWVEHLQQADLPAECIGIEITEGLLLDEHPEVLDKLRKLRAAGIQISLDDFGTGYSAMAYLKRFEIDYLKIDHSFVRDMASDPGDRAIVEAIIVMAHKLGIKVVAEGIETQEQLELLTSVGCDYGQGYLFSTPVPENEFAMLLTGL